MNRALLIAASIFCVCSISAAEAPTAQDQPVLALLNEVQAQQAKIAANQSALEAKLATVTEAVRMARIYASRGGH